MTTPEPDPVFVFDTAIGTCGLRWSGHGLAAVLLPGSRALPGPTSTAHSTAPDLARRAAANIASLLDGDNTDLRWIPLDPRGVDGFAARVYSATREIAPGATATYGEIARAAGDGHAARAVGVALARNPYPLVVPCHRVLAADGALHGFSAPGGLSTKRRLLEIEGAPGFTQQPLFA
jgi:methylated-DNA-[protein]-cysteine S-methyltransferase